MSPPPPGSQGSAGPRRQTRPTGLRSPSRAAGRSWPQLRPSLGPPPPSARGSMAWGGGVPSRPPSRHGQASGTGTSASARAGGPAAGGDRKLSSQRRGRLFMSRRRGLRGLSGGGGGLSRLAGRRRSQRDRRETLAVSGVLARARSRRRKPPAVGPGDRLPDRCFLKYVNISCESKVVV